LNPPRSASGAPPPGGAAGGPAEPDPRRALDAGSVASQRCGVVAIVGRPNVGKSTLLNALVGQKISITSAKAQTTRHRINGIRTVAEAQFVFVDTPGFQTRHGAALNRTLNRTVQGVLADVDVVLFVVEAGRFGLDDAKVLSLIQTEAMLGKPVLLVANKLDAVQRRADLAPWLKGMQDRHAFAEFVPLSAKKAADVERLLAIVKPYLPEQAWLHEADALTDRSERFLAGEIIREKLFRLTGDELPYTSTVVIDAFEEEGALRRIAASIVVERDAHKGMIIGAGGERLKRIGSEARQELETLMDGKVFLELFVKVRSGWAADEEHLRSYGYE
jgi:GTP-binding protein Era